jgi:hypothetical protein
MRLRFFSSSRWRVARYWTNSDPRICNRRHGAHVDCRNTVRPSRSGHEPRNRLWRPSRRDDGGRRRGRSLQCRAKSNPGSWRGSSICRRQRGSHGAWTDHRGAYFQQVNRALGPTSWRGFREKQDRTIGCVLATRAHWLKLPNSQVPHHDQLTLLVDRRPRPAAADAVNSVAGGPCLQSRCPDSATAIRFLLAR